MKGRDLVIAGERFGVWQGGIWWRVIDRIGSEVLGQRTRPPTSKPFLRSLRQLLSSRCKCGYPICRMHMTNLTYTN